MSAIPMQKNYKWYVIAMLWFICFLNYADRQAIFALFPLLRVEFHLSDMQLALVSSSFMWMYAVFGPVAGLLGDRFSRKWLILAGLVFWLCVTAATILARQYWQLAVLRALGGIAEAVYFPAAMSLISGYHGPETRSRAMAVHQSAVYAGTVGGGVLASVLGEYFGWRTNFICFGSLGLCLFFVLLVFLREPPLTAPATLPAKPVHQSLRTSLRDTFAEILASPLVLRLIVAFIGANFVAMVFMVWLPSFLFSKFHMSLSMAGVNATIYLQAASVGGVLLGGVLADLLARKDRGGRMRTQAFGLLAGMPFLFLTGWTLSVQVLILGMIGFGFCKGIYESNIWASLYDVVRPERRATAVGIMNSLGWLGGGVAPLAIAAGSQRFGMGACLSATSLVYILSASILIWNASIAAGNNNELQRVPSI
ncbi:MAG: MFS transporter [Formivibrio sp.]|nr:MFS transporter [Formivibrio sp.]